MSKQFHDEDDFFNLYRPKGEDSSDELPDDPSAAIPPAKDEGWDQDDIYSSQPFAEEDEENDREIFSSDEKKAMARSMPVSARHAKGDAVLTSKPKKKKRKRGMVGACPFVLPAHRHYNLLSGGGGI